MSLPRLWSLWSQTHFPQHFSSSAFALRARSLCPPASILVESLTRSRRLNLSSRQMDAVGNGSEALEAPRLSSSVVLLRKKKSAECDFEVLLAQRSSRMKSFSSAYVFPGGVTEPEEDRSLAERYLGGAATEREVTKLTGIRELFEEAGVLLTQGEQPQHSKAVFMPLEEQHAWQKSVHADPTKFQELVDVLKCKPAFSSLHYFVTFITPLIEKRRFRTNFFLAVVDDCDVNLDGSETVQFMWTTPSDALAWNRQGRMPFLPPQFFVLNTLSKFKKLEDAIRHIQQRPPLLPILPHAIGMDEETQKLVLVYPGDEEHPIYTGADGDRRRILCSLPFGKGGYEWRTNLPEEPNEKTWTGKTARSSL